MTMKSLKTGWLTFAAVAALLLALPVLAEDLLHARVSHESGGALIRGTQDTDWSYATINTIVLPSDTLWVDDEGTLEVEMAGGSFLRMADRTKAELQSLPPSTLINAWTGSFYVQRVSRSTGDLKLRTPAANITIDQDTQVRIDVVGEGSTTVSVRWGRVTVVTEGGAPVEARDGQRVYIDPGLLPSNAVPFDKTIEDAFDTWNRERARLLALGDSALPSSIQYEQAPIGYSDLASYGEWVTVDSRPYWRPTVVVDYVPYRDGYWNYGPAYGYSWTGSYPFCYVTSHYGRWNYYPAYGWLWNYDPVWSPAWCATAYYGGNFVWAPLNYYNRPCSYGATFYVGGVPFSIGYSSYCRSDDLFYGPCSVYPAYGDLFINVHADEINIWNIYGGSYRDRYPHYGSTALVRDYNPRRYIRGIESGGAFDVAASVRARTLNDGLGRAEFASRASSSTRAIRTSQASAARRAQVREISLNANTALDTSTSLRRAQRNMQSLRGSDDAKPQVAEARRSRIAAIERSAETAPQSKLPGADMRVSSARSVRDNSKALESLRTRSTETGIDRAKTPRSLDVPGTESRARVTPREEREMERSARSATPGQSTPGAGVDAEARVSRRTERESEPAGVSARARTRTPETLNNDSVGRVPDTRSRAPQTLDNDSISRGSKVPDTRSRARQTLDNDSIRSMEPAAPIQRTQIPDQARVRDTNVPRIGGESRGRSQSLGTIPQTPQQSRSALNTPVQTHVPQPSSREPQRRIIPDSSSRIREAAPQRTSEPMRIEQPRIQQAPSPQFEQRRMSAPPQRVETPRVEIQQPRYQAPQARQMQVPSQPSYQAPQIQPRVQAPRFEAPQQRQIQPGPSRPSSSSRAISGGGDSRGGGSARARSR